MRVLQFFQNYVYRQRGRCIAEQLRWILTHADIQRAFTNGFIIWEQSLYIIYTYLRIFYLEKCTFLLYLQSAKKTIIPSLIFMYYNIKRMS